MQCVVLLQFLCFLPPCGVFQGDSVPHFIIRLAGGERMVCFHGFGVFFAFTVAQFSQPPSSAFPGREVLVYFVFCLYFVFSSFSTFETPC